MIGTAYWYMHTDQYRYDGYAADALSSPLAEGHLAGMHTADTIAQATRLGWMPFYPQFDANPLDLADEVTAAVAAGRADTPGAYLADELTAGRLRFSVDDVDAPANWPRVLTLWRSNLFGSSAKGNEYFLKHLLGTSSNLMAEEGDVRPADVTWRDEAPEGKLDLLLSMDFRMTSSTLLSDVVLPAATWYEKHDLSSTDMHPFVHAFTPAIDPPWEAKSDFETFSLIARELSRQAAVHLGTRRDLVVVPMQHDTPGELAAPGGVVRDWRRGDVPAVPGKTMPNVTVVERDYTAIADKLATIGHWRRSWASPPRTSPSTSSAPSASSPPPAGSSPPVPPQAGRRSTPTPRWPRRSCPSRAPPTARWPSRASTTSSDAWGGRSPTSPRARRRSGSPSPRPSRPQSR